MPNFTRKLTAEQAATARDHYERRRSAPTVNAMAAKWGVSRGSVWNVVRGVGGKCRVLTDEQQAEARLNHAIRIQTKMIAELAREWGVSASTVSNDVMATRRADRKIRRALASGGTRDQEHASA